MVWPTAVMPVGVADLASVSAGSAVVVRVAVAVTGETAWPAAVPVARNVAATVPASASAWVVVYDAVQVSEAPGARVVAGQETVGAVPLPVNALVATASEETVVLPVLVTTTL